MGTIQCPGCGEVLDLIGGAERKPLVEEIKQLRVERDECKRIANDLLILAEIQRREDAATKGES